MIRRIELSNFRCFQNLGISLRPSQFLIGPNGSGKSAFLDAFLFVRDALTEGFSEAISRRSPNPSDMVCDPQQPKFSISLQLDLPEEIQKELKKRYSTCLYQISISTREEDGKGQGGYEALYLIPTEEEYMAFFPQSKRRTWRTVVAKTKDGNDYFQSEKTKWNNIFRIGPSRPALSNLPEDESRFPAGVWAKRFLMEKILPLNLQPSQLRCNEARRTDTHLRSDGSNLALVAQELMQDNPDAFEAWSRDVSKTGAGVEKISIQQQPYDGRPALKFFINGRWLPAWSVSDGFLRLAFYLILSHLNQETSFYLIEEVAAGLHPSLVKNQLQYLRRINNAQTIYTSQAPELISLLAPVEVLLLQHSSDGPILFSSQEIESICRNYSVSPYDLWKNGVREDLLRKA